MVCVTYFWLSFQKMWFWAFWVFSWHKEKFAFCVSMFVALKHQLLTVHSFLDWPTYLFLWRKRLFAIYFEWNVYHFVFTWWFFFFTVFIVGDTLVCRFNWFVLETGKIFLKWRQWNHFIHFYGFFFFFFFLEHFLFADYALRWRLETKKRESEKMFW
jgi:hypothetical protein